jgi:hypothetical protein
MESIVKFVAEKTGISESQAQVAVDTVASFLKEKLPAGMGSQLDSLIQGGGSMDSITDSLKDGLGGMFK